MNKNPNKKRLLVLGGSLWKEAIMQFAEENNITVIATGNDTTAGIFKVADEVYDINSTDQVKMKELIKEKNIDGVYMGGAEVVIGAACKYLSDLNMPCYCTPLQWETLQNKKNFKNLCAGNGLPVVPLYYSGGEVPRLEKELFPVVVKPVDGCGSSGVVVCDNNEELNRAFIDALGISSSQEVIVEKRVKNSGHVVFYTVSNGKIYFSGLSDKYPVKHENHDTYVGGLFLYRSKFTEDFRKLYEDKIQSMISSIGMREGTFWIEVFHDNGNYYFNEAGYRYGGSASIFPTDYFYGINQVAADIYFALSGQSKVYGHRPLFEEEDRKKKYYAVYPVHLKPGTICQIQGVGKLQANERIKKALVVKKEGDTIHDTGAFDQVTALIHMDFDNVKELNATIDFIHANLIVRDMNDNNMILRLLSLESANITLE